MEVKVGVSNRHVHLTREDFVYLFGDIYLDKKHDLNQSGEYASIYKVSLIGPKGEINNVRIVGPERSYTQVEVSKTDCYALGIDAPVRKSGNLLDASLITIANGDKKITKPCCIIANRHIHINKEDRKRLNLVKPYYKVKTTGDKASILDKVYIKEGESFNFELHLDTDDANANLLKSGDYVSIIDD